MQRTRLPFDPELAAVLASQPEMSISLRPEHIAQLRQGTPQVLERISDSALQRSGAIAFEEIMIPSADGSTELPLLLLRPARSTGPYRCVCFFHGGGMVTGDNRTGIDVVLDWVETLGLAVVSATYRLAPEHPHPVPVEDCYAALQWLSSHSSALGIEPSLMVAGTSAGGGLAAGVALMARDRGGPPISDQILMCPMIDDRASFPSSHELQGEGIWDARSNETGWSALLGAAKGGPEVSPYAAPSRARDLAGLPATFLDVGAVETFRDEVIDYAARLSQAGVSTELHVWSGAFHGFDVLAANTAVARAARQARIDYLRRRLRAQD